MVALGERDCSLQRRNQKVIEETPAPGLTDEVRRGAGRDGRAPRAGAPAIARPGPSSSSSTRPTGAFYFLEVNTRIQVEHGITEEVTGIDLVEWMVRLAAGDLPPLEQLPRRRRRARCHRGAPLCRGSPRAAFSRAAGTLTDGALSLVACASRPG